MISKNGLIIQIIKLKLTKNILITPPHYPDEI